MASLRRDARSMEMFPERSPQEQAAAFEALKGQFGSLYETLRGADIGRFMTQWWAQTSQELAAAFLPEPPINFLQNPTIRREMFVAGSDTGYTMLLTQMEAVFGDDVLRRALPEDRIGEPDLPVGKYRTSHNTIHHFSHLARFLAITGCDLDTIDTVVEWGGGYGNFAKIFVRFIARPVTYIMIDLPLMTAVQWLYLASLFGEERVHVLTQSGDHIREGCFNLLPVGLVEAYDLHADLFVSTWALSESSEYAQQFVIGRNWFRAPHLLLAFQCSNPKFEHATDVGLYAKRAGASLLPVWRVPENFYAFR